MGHFVVGEGLVILHKGNTLEFLRRAGDTFWFEDVSDGALTSFTEEQFWEEWETMTLRVVDAVANRSELEFEDPNVAAKKHRALNCLDRATQEDVDRMLSYIEGAIDAGITRGQLARMPAVIEAVAKGLRDSSPPGRWTLYRLWGKYEAAGRESSALIHGNRGAIRGSRAGKEIDGLVTKAIHEDYLTLRRPTVAKSFEHYEGLTKIKNIERLDVGLPPLYVISPRTFRRRIYEIDAYDRLVARHGFVRARQMLRQAQGELFAQNALDIVETDDTPVNLWVIDDDTCIPLGRPYITVSRCRATRALLGMFVTFQAPSLRSSFGVLRHSLLPHTNLHLLCDDLAHTWPMHGVGKEYLYDNGPAYTAEGLRRAVRHGLGARYKRVEMKLPWHKAGIERTFLDFEHLLETMPGRTFASLALRGDYDPKKDAVVRFSTFVSCLTKWAVDIYNVSRPVRGGPTPYESWMESVATVPPRYPRSPEELQVVLGERRTGRLTHEGIQLYNLHYCDDASRRLVHIFGANQSFDYLYHPENIGAVHIINPRDSDYVRVGCTRPDYAEGKSIYQHKLIQKEARLMGPGPYTPDHLLDAQLSLSQRIREDMRTSKPKNPKAAAQAADINSERVSAGEKPSAAKPFGAELDVSTDEAPVTDVPTFAWG